MSPPNIARVTEVFELTFLAMNKGTDGVCAAVAKYVTGAMDPGVVELLLKWIAEWVLAKAGWDPSKRALAIALRVEYMLRSSSAIKAWRLTNKCSQCHCIGHNKQNHTHAFDAFLAGKGCEDAGFEMHDVVEGYNDNKTELDGWFEWL